MAKLPEKVLSIAALVALVALVTVSPLSAQFSSSTSQPKKLRLDSIVYYDIMSGISIPESKTVYKYASDRSSDTLIGYVWNKTNQEYQPETYGIVYVYGNVDSVVQIEYTDPAFSQEGTRFVYVLDQGCPVKLRVYHPVYGDPDQDGLYRSEVYKTMGPCLILESEHTQFMNGKHQLLGRTYKKYKFNTTALLLDSTYSRSNDSSAWDQGWIEEYVYKGIRLEMVRSFNDFERMKPSNKGTIWADTTFRPDEILMPLNSVLFQKKYINKLDSVLYSSYRTQSQSWEDMKSERLFYSSLNQTSVEPKCPAANMQIWPNPARERISWSAPFKGLIVLRDHQGRVLQTISIDEPSTTSMMLPELNCGSYSVQFRHSSGDAQSYKLLIAD